MVFPFWCQGDSYCWRGKVNCVTLEATNSCYDGHEHFGLRRPTARYMTNSERRAVPRYSFIAAAEIVDPASGVRMAGRISEISRKGCYVDLLNTLPMGTPIQLRVSRDQGTFACNGRIIYAQDGMGMGVVFVDLQPDQLKTLDSWLAELTG